jgi:hypothetical protein
MARTDDERAPSWRHVREARPSCREQNPATCLRMSPRGRCDQHSACECASSVYLITAAAVQLPSDHLTLLVFPAMACAGAPPPGLWRLPVDVLASGQKGEL